MESSFPSFTHDMSPSSELSLHKHKKTVPVTDHFFQCLILNHHFDNMPISVSYNDFIRAKMRRERVDSGEPTDRDTTQQT